MTPVPDRRQVLKSLGLFAGGFAAGCATAQRALFFDPPRRFARVRVSPDRVIRTVAGLRPYRPSGFVVRVDKLDGKVLVHNYGHGGAGVSLSWGTAELAVDLATASGASRYAVLGCGAVGLATARLLQRRGHDVVIYARDLPPNTTSNIAGAEWGVFSVVETDRRTPAFDEQIRPRRAALAPDVPGPRGRPVRDPLDRGLRPRPGARARPARATRSRRRWPG